MDANISDDSVADNGWDESEEHDDTTELKPVGDYGDNDSDYRGDSVRNDGPELGFVRGVAEFNDDGR